MHILRIGLVLFLSLQMTGFPQNKKTTPGRELIQISAVVTDVSGRFVEGLAEQDLILLENDVEQDLDSVSMVRTEGQSAPRAIILLLDTAHTSGEALERVRMALRQFLDNQLGAQDTVVFVTSSGNPGTKGEFSTNREKLKADMNKVRPGYTGSDSFLSPALCGRVVKRDPQAVSLATLILDSEERRAGGVLMPSGPNPEAEAVSRCMMLLLETSSHRRALMSSIGAAVDKVASMPGQHILALFSEGFSMTATGGDIAISEARPAISNAVRSGVMIYAFDARIPLSSKPPNTESYSLAAEILNSKLDLQHGMGLLAGQTGGDAYFSLDGLNDQLQKMLDTNRASYRLAYYPLPVSDPRKYRAVSVSVKGHPEYQVRTAKGYDMTGLRRGK